jgi:hypothetical protein
VANGITTALEDAAKKIGKSLGEDLSKAWHGLTHDTADKVEASVKAHVEHDTKSAADLENAAKHVAAPTVAGAESSVKVGAQDVLGKTADQLPASATQGLSAELRDSVGHTYDNAHPGPLTEYADTFTDGRYTVGVTTEPRRFMRAGDAGATRGDPALGQFHTDTPPESVSQVRHDLAVLPEWPNGAKSPLNTGFDVEYPAGTVFYYGEVGPQGPGYPGGGMQYLIKTPWDIRPLPVEQSRWPLKP